MKEKDRITYKSDCGGYDYILDCDLSATGTKDHIGRLEDRNVAVKPLRKPIFSIPSIQEKLRVIHGDSYESSNACFTWRCASCDWIVRKMDTTGLTVENFCPNCGQRQDKGICDEDCDVDG